jgi:hypothetical protein
MVKILYLLADVALKQAIDEAKAVTNEYLDYLRKYRELVATYSPDPAVQAGSVEEHQFIARAQHQAAVNRRRLVRQSGISHLYQSGPRMKGAKSDWLVYNLNLL